MTSFRGDPSCVNWPGCVVSLWPSSAATLPASARVSEAKGAKEYPYSS